ncbi:c-type cytochrome [Alteraurantiacibacter aquimixticola]|uniref:Cytochrome c family protein n=1 Tax=Alteraurantiacibacter aquimixticola TaxID=2489173 RepID=A0A4T3F7X4_9SPHN|nr:cytochrome c family protein [Alteraurantiacibacter aquimixticola]TIX51100.1 cytochrome c family protein [Alteraurantiacibacter aquimixticola]
MTDRLNTIFGWLLFAGVVALMMRFAMNLIMPDAEMPEQPGYVIEAADAGGADQGPALATLLAGGDAAAGGNSFAKCVACHTIDQGGANGIGPNLFGVLGQPVGQHVAGFDYSSALADHGGEWTYENMDAWLSSPRAFANGTKMSFAGLSDPQERANVMLYLMENGGGPALPEPPVEEPAAEEGDAAGAEEGEAVAEDAAEEGAEAELEAAA